LAHQTAFLTKIFKEQYPDAPAPRLFRAPGRVNLIGEHTDYNLGFVLPIAIHLACYTAASDGTQGMLRIYSRNVDEHREFKVAMIPHLKPTGDWSDYVVGVAQQLLRADYTLRALNMAIDSTVPVGSGLSSSAAIEVSTALALLNRQPIDPVDLARLCQRAEREFVGMPCGIMDQYVSVQGEENKAIKIDCRSITHESVSLPKNVSIVAVNSMVKHDLGSSAYAHRVRECAEAVAVIQRQFPEVASLRDVSSEQVLGMRDKMPDVPYRRALHVTSEDERVVQFVQSSSAGDLRRMGELFVASHRSLQHDYEVSCAELDFLVDMAITLPGVYGSRMTGGGFGGCTVNLVDPGQVDAFKSAIAEKYRAAYGIEAQILDCIPAAGAHEIV
jgi:galactokinase